MTTAGASINEITLSLRVLPVLRKEDVDTMIVRIRRVKGRLYSVQIVKR